MSPVIATILMVAITVVLAAVLYVMVSGLVTPTGNAPQPIGVNVSGDLASGTQWKLAISSAPSRPSAADVTLVLTPASGVAVSGPLSGGTLPNNVTWNDVINSGTVDAGDFIGVLKSVYPAGTTFQLIVAGTVAASGTLQ